MKVPIQRLWNAIKGEAPKALLGVIISALGFLLALGINGWLERRTERETYKSMITAIRYEATANKNVLDTSYRKFFPDGLVIKEFSYSTITQAFANPIFIKYANSRDVETINAYVRDLTLANGYRRYVENLDLLHPSEYKNWRDQVTDQWGQRLPDLYTNIDKVLAIKE